MNILAIVVLFCLAVVSGVWLFLNEKSSLQTSVLMHVLFAFLSGVLAAGVWSVVLYTSMLPSKLYLVLQILITVVILVLTRFYLSNKFRKYNKPITSSILLYSVGILTAWLLCCIALNLLHPIDFGCYLGSVFIVAYFPLIFELGFQEQVRIPDPIYKLFQWPDEGNSGYRDYVKMDDLAVITLEYKHHIDSPTYSGAQFKAPYNYILKDYFYDFLEEYNSSMASEEEIALQDEYGDYYDWSIYIKPKNSWSTKKFLDPDKSLAENEIYEYCTVVFDRVKRENA